MWLILWAVGFFPPFNCNALWQNWPVTLDKTFFSVALTKKVKTTSVPPGVKLFWEQIPSSSRAVAVLKMNIFQGCSTLAVVRRELFLRFLQRLCTRLEFIIPDSGNQHTGLSSWVIDRSVHWDFV